VYRSPSGKRVEDYSKTEGESGYPEGGNQRLLLKEVGMKKSPKTSRRGEPRRKADQALAGGWTGGGAAYDERDPEGVRLLNKGCERDL